MAIITNLSPAANRNFGSVVAISGTCIVVGDYEAYAGATNAGRAFVYELTSATPSVPVAVLNNPSPAEYDCFGYAAAIDGTTIIIGAPGDGTDAAGRGAAYIFGLRPALSIVPAASGFAAIS